MDVDVYVDETGDLGFSFERPHRNGGSSRFLTIGFLLVPHDLAHLTKRIVKKIYIKRRQVKRIELKSVMLSHEEKENFCRETVVLVEQYNSIKLFGITVFKQRVADHIRRDSNKLYNYMIGLALPDKVRAFERINFTPDPRSIKVKSGNSLSDYLQIKLWFDHDSKTIIRNLPMESHQSLNLQFVDILSYIIWKHYEDGENTLFNMIRRELDLKQLFFP